MFVELEKGGGGGKVTHLSEREQTSSAFFFVRERMRWHKLINHRGFSDTGG